MKPLATGGGGDGHLHHIHTPLHSDLNKKRKMRATIGIFVRYKSFERNDEFLKRKVLIFGKIFHGFRSFLFSHQTVFH